MKLLTWNIWFDPYENKRRWDALISEALAYHPDIIGLQEVTLPIMERISADPRLSKWCYSEPKLDARSSYDVLLMTRDPAQFTRYPLRSQMGRALVYTELQGLTVGTVHLESLRPNGQQRAHQLAEISTALASRDDALFMGDMNFPDHAPEESALHPIWRDLWRELHPEREGFTIDTTRNIMRLRAKRGRRRRARYDRAFLKSHRWDVQQIELVGVDALPYDRLTLPSDHFGVYIELIPRRASPQT